MESILGSIKGGFVKENEKRLVVRVGDAENTALYPTALEDQTKVLLMDPPYGLAGSWKKSWHGNNGNSTLRNGVVPLWDMAPMKQSTIDQLILWADIAIIWGGNYYNLPPSPIWFVWDKLQSNRGSDAELAWTNAKIKGVKVFRMSRIDAYFNKRVFVKKHVAEKPVQLMSWCLENLKLDKAVVFDPCCGAGGSIVAANKLGFDAYGLDLNQVWVDETLSRVSGDSNG